MPTPNITLMLRRFYNQTIVYWAKSGNSGYGSTFLNPVEITGRWEDKQEIVKSESGEDILSSSVIYTESDLSIGSYVYLGDLDDVSSTVLGPEDVSQSREIIASGKISNKSATAFLRKYYLR